MLERRAKSELRARGSDMGGMFTILKVREKLAGDKDLGWYEHPSATVATKATLARDGIKP